jgi:hypothetical protein
MLFKYFPKICKRRYSQATTLFMKFSISVRPALELVALKDG